MLKIILTACLLAAPLQLEAQAPGPNDDAVKMCRDRFLFLKPDGVAKLDMAWEDATDMLTYERHVNITVSANGLEPRDIMVHLRECLPADQIGKHE